MSDLISRSKLIEEIKNDLALKYTGDVSANFISGMITRQYEIVDIINNQPTVEAVPKSYAEQIRWERDVAVGQLNEIGCQFGQKMDEVKDKLNSAKNWIPCSERMPKIRESLHTSNCVLTTMVCDDGNIGVSVGFYHREIGWVNVMPDEKVIAWMPLPEPYKADMRTSAE